MSTDFDLNRGIQSILIKWSGERVKTRVEDFTKSNNVIEILNELRKLEMPLKHHSDIIDEQGNQYVDLVQEGGGVLGVSLLGYTYVMEEMGIRFFSLAGTSAGAINTLLLATYGKIDEKKSEKILETLITKNLFDFVDGPPASKKLVKSVINSSWIGIKIFWALCSIKYLIENKGLNPGNDFYNWVRNILREHNVICQLQLTQLRAGRSSGLRVREGINRSIDDLIPKLKIIAADITTETRVIFPEMNELYWDIPNSVNPAEYLRSSMSIPGFFQPYKIKLGNYVRKEDWVDLAKYHGDLPQEAVFVDGGIMSNFPIDVFHNKKNVPRLPTFGVKLGDDRNVVNKVDSIPQFLMSIFNSARHVLDYTFLLQNSDYEKLITKVDVGSHNWLNFSMSDEEKIDLFIRGAKAAGEFLKKFDWEEYKKIRESMIKT